MPHPPRRPPAARPSAVALIWSAVRSLVGLLPLLVFAARVRGCGASLVWAAIRAFGAVFVAGLAAGLAAAATWIATLLAGGMETNQGIPLPKPWARALIALASFAAWLSTALRLTRC